MSDTSEKPPLARRAGRGLLRALAALFGGKSLVKARDSAAALTEEFRAGRGEADTPPEARRIPHRERGPTA